MVEEEVTVEEEAVIGVEDEVEEEEVAQRKQLPSFLIYPMYRPSSRYTTKRRVRVDHEKCSCRQLRRSIY